MSLDCEVVLTRSGARAMLDKNSGEIMHPVVGPLTEAERLYVAPSRLAERLSEYRATTAQRSTAMTAQPSTAMTAQPSTAMTAQPSTAMTARPSTAMTAQPSTAMTAQPSTATTAQPSTAMTAQPSTAMTAQPLVLFDVGLGAGSNAAAALRLSESLPQNARRLQIVSFDVSLAALELALQPAHAAAFGLDGVAGHAARELLSRGHYDSPRTSWRLSAGDLRTTLTREPALSADIVFWDPFSPRSNPELWTLEAFAALRRVCSEVATVHTYSGATAVRSALLLAGFHVSIGEKIAEGKFGTHAALEREALHQPLDLRWLARLSRSSAPFPKDAPPDAMERIRRMPQFS